MKTCKRCETCAEEIERLERMNRILGFGLIGLVHSLDWAAENGGRILRLADWATNQARSARDVLKRAHESAGSAQP